MEKPILTEPGVKYFMNEVLKTCNERKSLFTNSIFNLISFLIFVLIIGGFLYYKYRGKLTPQEKEAKLREQKQVRDKRYYERHKQNILRKRMQRYWEKMDKKMSKM